MARAFTTSTERHTCGRPRLFALQIVFQALGLFSVGPAQCVHR